jgi:hypothetical protein
MIICKCLVFFMCYENVKSSLRHKCNKSRSTIVTKYFVVSATQLSPVTRVLAIVIVSGSGDSRYLHRYYIHTTHALSPKG